jgi:glycerate-2-kinase
MALPAPDITLDDKRRTTDRLLRAGADIHALNGVRKHLSSIKGGLLAAACRGTTRTYVISDVVTDDLSAIGSGPTVPDPTTFADALNTLDRFGGRGAYPPSVIERLERGRRGEVAETPKPGDSRLTRAHATIVGSRVEGMAGAAREAASRGYRVETLADPVTGEARLAALAQVEIVAARRQPGVPTCVISSGETTVHVTGDGRGGRNLEFALAVATRATTLGVPFAAASVGTDGVDGPTDAAGALVDDTTLDRARAAGLGSPERALASNDSYTFFEGLDDLIHTGPTGTNVGDLQVFLLV